MTIERAVKLITSIPDHWVGVEQLRKIMGGLELWLAIHNESRKRGKKIATWCVTCNAVRETHITDLDGGGLAVYPGDHPAARQYTARQAELRWPDVGRIEPSVLGALYEAHTDLVGDWIPFDRYGFGCYALDPDLAWGDTVRKTVKDYLVLRGPEGLLRSYAKALLAQGEHPRLISRRDRKARSSRLKVLHFGSSYVVAGSFSAKRQS